MQLPYADLGEIPASALPALKALYAENIMRGANGEDGRLYLMPNSGLTRAHAAAMIGRSQKLGYGSADLPFPDADSIPAYAVPHIRTMVARGILEGYADGYFRSGNKIFQLSSVGKAISIYSILYNMGGPWRKSIKTTTLQ